MATALNRSPDHEREPMMGEMDPRSRLFLRLWGIVAVSHVVGNWHQPDLPAPAGFALLAVGLVGIGLALTPARPVFLVLSGLVVVSALLEMPEMGNHWFIAAMVSLAALVTRGVPDRFAPAGRWVFLVFYSIAAFNKLNEGFFTPEVSCGLFYTNQSLQAAGMDTISPGSPLAWLPIVGAVVIELAVPVLLLIRRTRYWGILVAAVFHILISYDLSQHFYDFTALLLALFVLFLPVETARGIERRLAALPARLRLLMAATFTALAAIMVVSAVIPPRPTTGFFLLNLPFYLWIPFSLFFLWGLIRYRTPSEEVSLRLSPLVAVVVAMVFLNGLTPYLELKTAYGYNMYANLITAQGRTNHFLIPATLPLRDGYAGPVEIVESDDPGLDHYRQRGYLVAFPQFRQYLADNPEVAVTYRRGGETSEVSRAGDDPILSVPGPWWWRFFPLRSLDVNDPPRCQDVWLPAL